MQLQESREVTESWSGLSEVAEMVLCDEGREACERTRKRRRHLEPEPKSVGPNKACKKTCNFKVRRLANLLQIRRQLAKDPSLELWAKVKRKYEAINGCEWITRDLRLTEEDEEDITTLERELSDVVEAGASRALQRWEERMYDDAACSRWISAKNVQPVLKSIADGAPGMLFEEGR